MPVQRAKTVLGAHQHKRRALEGGQRRLLVSPVAQSGGLAGKDLGAQCQRQSMHRSRIDACRGRDKVVRFMSSRITLSSSPLRHGQSVGRGGLCFGRLGPVGRAAQSGNAVRAGAGFHRTIPPSTDPPGKTWRGVGEEQGCQLCHAVGLRWKVVDYGTPSVASMPPHIRASHIMPG